MWAEIFTLIKNSSEFLSLLFMISKAKSEAL
nr:MAG TPA: hypothetical protein [Caudoviricetes sp.]